jgi:tRNA (cmo5U34)-methyltransferase
VAQFHWDPDAYLALMHEEVPDYERLQDETVAATGTDAKRVLELGTGTGVTAQRVLVRHPAAVLVGLDASSKMLDHARAALPADRVELRVARLTDPLPAGPFDVVVSALAVHHLDGAGKADLFRRVAGNLTPGGRLVLGDVVVPEDPSDLVTPIDGDYDTPSTAADQLRWLAAAGLHSRVAWAHRDLAVLVGRRPPRPDTATTTGAVSPGARASAA